MFEELKVKVGDKVIVSNRCSETVTTVSRITPTGRIRVACYPSVQYDKYGNEMGGDIWNSSHLEEATPERLELIKRKKTVRVAYSLMSRCDNLTYEQAVKVIDILGGDE